MVSAILQTCDRALPKSIWSQATISRAAPSFCLDPERLPLQQVTGRVAGGTHLRSERKTNDPGWRIYMQFDDQSGASDLGALGSRWPGYSPQAESGMGSSRKILSSERVAPFP